MLPSSFPSPSLVVTSVTTKPNEFSNGVSESEDMNHLPFHLLRDVGHGQLLRREESGGSS